MCMKYSQRLKQARTYLGERNLYHKILFKITAKNHERGCASKSD